MKLCQIPTQEAAGCKLNVLWEGRDVLETGRDGCGDRVERGELHDVGVVLQDVSADRHDEGF